jgi:hypothetical protein
MLTAGQKILVNGNPKSVHPLGILAEDLWLLIAAHLPNHYRSPKGGRQRVDDRAALAGILFVLRTGIPGGICRVSSVGVVA